MNVIERMKQLIKTATIEQINKFYNALNEKQKAQYAEVIAAAVKEAGGN